MKTRLGFVSNSSSSSFIITNKTDQEKTLIDLLKELEETAKTIFDEYNGYTIDDYYGVGIGMLEKEHDKFIWKPKESKNIEMYDSNCVGMVFDVNRLNEDTVSFSVEFQESHH
jgi:hypothetical protein